VAWEYWRLVIAKSVLAALKSLSSSDTFASRAAFSRAAVWEASRAVVSDVAVAVLSLSVVSSADAAATRSFLISASTSVSLDARESRLVTAAMAAVFGGDGSVFRGLTGGLKGRPRGCLGRHSTGCGDPSYDK
jgi:hypothetical protein